MKDKTLLVTWVPTSVVVIAADDGAILVNMTEDEAATDNVECWTTADVVKLGDKPSDDA